MTEPRPAEQADEIARLRRRLDRERAARSAADQLAEDATRRLYLGLEEQRRTAALLRAVVDASRDAISAKDCDGRFTMVNAALAAIWDCPPEALLGQSVALPGVNEGWEARIAAMDQRVIESKAGEQAEETLDWPDGRRHVLSITKEPLLDEEGSVVGVCTVSRDLTGERQAETRLREAEQVEAMARARSEFLTTISHEIRTPMNGVIGMTTLLGQTSLTAQQDEYVEVIRSCGELLLGIVNDVLDLSKLEAGRLELENVPFSLRRCIAGAVDLMAPAAAAKGLSLVSQPVAVEPDSLLGDPTRIRQLLVNLLANAVNFTSAGEVTVSVSGRPAGVGRFQLFLSVSDTGPGIPREQQARLFEPFSQPDSSAGRAYGGTGLGLTLCSRLCQLMGGTISVVSQPGRGSVFTASIELGLPLRRGQGPADGGPGDRRTFPTDHAIGLLPLPEVPMAQRAPLRILLAEGKGTSRKVALGLLARLGYRADTAENGQAALDAVARTPYDVVLMDVQMPGMDGLSATRHLRRRFGAQPRVIAVAKGALAADVTLCLEAGMDDYLAKPIDAIELAAALERAFAHLPQTGAGR
ncbi:MAG: hypothetical protein QOD57_4602 [Actinomycetota bacterium]|jgi:PAS domain S-box-containing protein|nr:hypothetical protein [Actinomycetota bacterium]MDQ1506875.1 hypothetical protein [Actinomycetota bacterium]